MSSSIQVVPSGFFSSHGCLIVPGHHGDGLACKMQRSWAPETESSERNIFFEVGGSKSLISVDPLELLTKLKLKSEDVELIKGERDLSRRSLMLKNIVMLKSMVEKQDRGNQCFRLFSLPMYSSIRQNNPEEFLEELQNILDSGYISLPILTKSFEILLEEYIENPSENFFVLSEKLLEKIFIESDRIALSSCLDKLAIRLENLCQEDSNIDVSKFRGMLNQIALVRSNPGIQAPASDLSSSVQRTYLRWISSDADVFTYLGLDAWQTGGDKVEACRRLVECFKKQNARLDLSNLHLTSLPDNLKNFLFVKELNLSSNQMQNLVPLSQLSYLTTLDLSSNKMGGREGMSDFIPLKNLENLQSVKLLYMDGDLRRAIDRVRIDLIHCERIEWTDSWGLHRVFSRREGELLGPFLRRRERVFCNRHEGGSNRTLTPYDFQQSLIPDNPKDPAALESLPVALERLGLTGLDIDSLISKDPNIISWLNRLAVQEGYKGLPIWKDLTLRPALSQKVLEILRCALEHPSFFEDILTPLVSNSVIHCGDRTLYYFNEIARRMELFKAKDLPVKEALLVYRKYFPVALIKKISKQSIEERALDLPPDESEQLRKEELEVELGLLIRFKDEFQVPLAFSKGYFTNTGEETRTAFLDQAALKMRASLKSSQNWIQYLASDPEWRMYLLQHSFSLESELQRQEEAISLSIEELEAQKSQITDFEYSRRYFDLMQRDQVESRAILAKETEKFLRAHKSI